MQSLELKIKKEIHSRLVSAAYEIFRECQKLVENRDPDELINLTEESQHVKHHQTYGIDDVVYNISSDVLKKVFEDFVTEPTTPKFGKRFEHSDQPIINPDCDYMLLCNPIEGGDNFAKAIKHSALKRKKNITEGFNPESCITLAFVDTNQPFNPIATVVYHFLNHEVYSSISVSENDTPWAFYGTSSSLVHPKSLSIMQKEATFFIADYKNIFRIGPTLLEQSLIDYGRGKGLSVDLLRGKAASTSNMCQILDGEVAVGYIDGRSDMKLESGQSIPSNLSGKYAKLLYTNVISAIPIARGYGFKVTDIEGNELSASNLNLKDKFAPNGNAEITLVMAPPHYFSKDGFNIIEGLEKGKVEARTQWTNCLASGKNLQLNP